VFCNVHFADSNIINRKAASNAHKECAPNRRGILGRDRCRSMCGTNAGDLAAGPLGLGHVRGIIPIAAVFLTIVWARRL